MKIPQNYAEDRGLEIGSMQLTRHLIYKCEVPTYRVFISGTPEREFERRRRDQNERKPEWDRDLVSEETGWKKLYKKKTEIISWFDFNTSQKKVSRSATDNFYTTSLCSGFRTDSQNETKTREGEGKVFRKKKFRYLSEISSTIDFLVARY